MSDLPPLDAPQAYVVVGPDDQRGPYTMELLIGEVLAGRLSEATPVWWPGLADWTTMGGHPAVSAEIARRRNAAAAPAPAWAPDPSVPSSAPEPSYEQPQATSSEGAYGQPGTYGAPEPASYEQPAVQEPASYEQPAVQEPASYEQPAVQEPASYEQPAAQEPASYESTGYQSAPYEAAPFESGQYESAEPAGYRAPVEHSTEYIEVDAVPGGPAVGADVAPASAEVDEETRRTFESFVARSSERSSGVDHAAVAEEELIQSIVSGLGDSGYTPAGRDVVDGSTELRFDSPDGRSSLQVSLGRFGDVSQDELAGTVVPLEVSASSASSGGGASTTTGEHGEIRVVSDEWSGRATSSVSLVLGLEDYLDDRFVVDRAAVARDVTAIAAVVRSRLG